MKEKLLALLLLCCLHWGAAAETAPELFFLRNLAPGVYAAINGPAGGAGANAGFVISDDGVLVIDSLTSEAAAEAMLAEIRKLTTQPVRYLVNTHYHLDHVAGNAVFQKAGAVIIAQRDVVLWLRTENMKFFGTKARQEEIAMVQGLAKPQVLLDGSLEILLGRRKVVIKTFSGHTGGDSIISIPDAKITFGGDLFWNRALPNLIDAKLNEWLSTLQQLQSHGATIYVPGHGEPGELAELQAFSGYLSDLKAWVGARPVAADAKRLQSEVLPLLQAKYGDWKYFSSFSAQNIRYAAAERDGHKIVPKRQADSDRNPQ